VKPLLEGIGMEVKTLEIRSSENGRWNGLSVEQTIKQYRFNGWCIVKVEWEDCGDLDFPTDGMTERWKATFKRLTSGE
jgi:hypothetical protein